MDESKENMQIELQGQQAPTVGERIALRKSWLQIAVISVITIVLGWRILTASVQVDLAKFDYSDLISLFLAFFAIGLSVAFYMKNTETSNRFYDNTYQFTKDVSTILGRIEERFGERLRHLDEGYSGLRASFEKMPFDRAQANEEIEKEEEELEVLQNEKNKLLQDLAEKAKLQEEEKANFFEQLSGKEKELRDAHRELRRMRRHLDYSDSSSSIDYSRSSDVFLSYFKRLIADELHPSILNEPSHVIRASVHRITSRLSPKFLEDGRKMRIFDEKGFLTQRGARVLGDLISGQDIDRIIDGS